MSATVAIRAAAIGYPEGGGHLWAYVNWALGAREAGCRVLWVEQASASAPPEKVAAQAELLAGRLAAVGLDDSLVLHVPGNGTHAVESLADADLLLDLAYDTRPEVLAPARRTALVDIDPGLLQLWMAGGHLAPHPHDAYFTTAEGVGRPGNRVPDCGLTWVHSPPPVSLAAWPCTDAEDGARYSTVSHWVANEWLDLDGEPFCNDKRTGFADYLDVPGDTDADLELALCLADEERDERQALERRGWWVRDAERVAGDPDDYRHYVQASRGEFSCVKPSCRWTAVAWVGDRTPCYLASGKPAIVEHTGDSSFLPDAEGLFRFDTPAQAAAALAEAERDYEHHCAAARELAERWFDARRVVEAVLDRALG